MDRVTLHQKDFKILFTAESIQQRIQEVVDSMSTTYEDKNPIFLIILNGGFRLGADVVQYCKFPCSVAFIKLKSYEGTASTGKVNMLLDSDIDLKDRHIIILEDIVDTGKTLHTFLPHLQQKHQPQSIAIFSLLLKPAALQHKIPLDFIGFEIGNEFVVGYGLDYDDAGRELNAIYQAE